MRASLSSSGVWRIPATFVLLRYGSLPWLKTPLGKFHCADYASLIQFLPSWEPSVKEEVQNSNGLFVDVGANIGFYSIMGAKKGNKVIAVEPNQKAYDCLMDNVKVNELSDRVIVYNAPAWSKIGWLKFVSGHHTDVSRVSEDGESMMAITLDTVIGTECPSLVKIDAEGSEPEILAGTEATLDRCHPKVIFEALSEDKLRECKNKLKGYFFKRLDRTNYLAS